MKKYEVTFYVHSNCTIKVDALSKEEAMSIALSKMCLGELDNQILNGIQEDGSPDIKEVEI